MGQRPPAVLTGWLDRVPTDGFALGGLDPETGLPRRYGEGGLAGRRALVVVTAGEDARSIGSRGISGDLEGLLFPRTRGTLWSVGIDVLDLHVVQREVDRLRRRLDGLADEPARPFRRLRDGEHPDRALRPDLAPGRTDLAIHRAG